MIVSLFLWAGASLLLDYFQMIVVKREGSCGVYFHLRAFFGIINTEG